MYESGWFASSLRNAATCSAVTGLALFLFGALSGAGRGSSGFFPVLMGTVGCMGVAMLCMVFWLLTMLSNLARLCEHPRLRPPAFED